MLLDGTGEASFPPLLHGRVYADFRVPRRYFTVAFDLLLSLYALGPQEPPAAELRRWVSGETL